MQLGYTLGRMDARTDTACRRREKNFRFSQVLLYGFMLLWQNGGAVAFTGVGLLLTKVSFTTSSTFTGDYQ